MTPELLSTIQAHAISAGDREACGLLVWNGANDAIYHPCRNIGEDDCFSIHPEDWVAAEDSGTILGVAHSHPNGDLTPSPADVYGCDRSGLPWWIFDTKGNWNRITPASWSLEGHPFAWGVQDCWTLARDAFHVQVDFLRSDGSEQFEERLADAGFERVEGDPLPGDGLLMSIRAGGRVNHCAIYTGAGMIVHHLGGRLSRREYMGPLARAVVAVVRRVR